MIAMIKNNLKLMLRNKMVLVMMLVAPILVIAALTSAFHDLLSTGYDKSHITVGYYFEEDSLLYPLKDTFEEGFSTEDITLRAYGENAMEDAIKEEDVDVFIYCDKDHCILGGSDVEDVSFRVCQYTMHRFAQEFSLASLSMEKMMVEGTDITPVKIKTASLPYMKTASAEDYYGIIEIIYFLWCGMLFLTSVISSERKNRIQSRYAISPTSAWRVYLGKFIPCCMISFIFTAISGVVATLLFDIHWGNLPATIGILALTLLTGTAFGILLVYLFSNIAAAVVTLFSAVWLMGFVGGSFETYMFANYPESIKLLSPIYHVNRTLVEYSTMGQSDYARGCVIYLSAWFMICVLLGSILMKRRTEAK